MDFQQKYLKYKTKYFQLKSQYGGSNDLKLYFLNQENLNKVLEEDSNIIKKLTESKTKIEKYIEDIKKYSKLTGQSSDSSSQAGGLFGLKSRSERKIEKTQKKEEKALKKAEKASESIKSQASALVAKKQEQLQKLNIVELLTDINLSSSKCNLINNGLPFYQSLKLTEKLTWSLDKFVPFVTYNKEFPTGYGDNYSKLQNLLQKYGNTKYIVVVREITGQKDILICCFKVNDDKTIKIADPEELRITFKGNTSKGVELRKQIMDLLNNNISLLKIDNEEEKKKLRDVGMKI